MRKSTKGRIKPYGYNLKQPILGLSSLTSQPKSGRDSQVVHLAAFILVYNVLAFVSQPITGIMTDILEQKDRMLCGAVVCLSFAVFLTMIMSYAESKQMLMIGFLVSAFLGVGNSLFHVWGGKRIVMQNVTFVPEVSKRK